MLIRRDGQLPPGGWYYEDPKTGHKFQGMGTTFVGQVQSIITHRQANPKIYPVTDLENLNFDLVANQLDNYTCQRLGSHPAFCVSEKDPRLRPSAQASIVVPQCPKCLSAMTPKYCPTCGGQKIIGFNCPTCGYQRDK